MMLSKRAKRSLYGDGSLGKKIFKILNKIFNYEDIFFNSKQERVWIKIQIKILNHCWKASY